jgi:hypothetical protein
MEKPERSIEKIFFTRCQIIAIRCAKGIPSLELTHERR